jgi:YHS domain-containing protein
MLLTTVPFRIFSMRIPFGRLLPTTMVLLTAVCAAAEAAAGVAWHPDLAAARHASTLSQRPVLAIFTASWSSVSSTLDRTTLASDEAVALISACFEPVCVDVDAHPETTRRLGIQRVPTACVLTADEQPLSTFELPETPAEFVAAAARAAQEAATATAAGRQQARAATTEVASPRHAMTDLTAGGSSALPDLSSPVQLPPRGSVPPGGQAITAVAAKVRRLSDFASDDAPTSPDGDAIAASFRKDGGDSQGALVPETATLAPAPTASRTSAAPFPTSSDTATLPTPPLATTTPAFAADGGRSPAETGSAATIAPTQPTASAAEPAATIAVRAPLSIEPAASAAPSGSTHTTKSPPWLANTAPTAPAAEPPAQPQSAATPPAPATGTTVAQQPAPQAPGAAVAAAPAEAAPQKSEKPAASGSQAFLAALQKPFSIFAPQAKPTAAATRSGEEGAAGSRPTNASTAQPESVAGKAPTAEPDRYGSMPVGLEGYCPVTLTEKGTWVEGRAQWGVRHRGRTYLFAGAEQQKAFLADPDRYAPALSGDDPVLAFDAGKSTPGQRRYGVTYQSRMYLFSSTETRDAFAANPQRYTTGAQVAENRVPTSGTVVR